MGVASVYSSLRGKGKGRQAEDEGRGWEVQETDRGEGAKNKTKEANKR